MISKYTLPPLNLYNFWMYNKKIREYDDKTIYKDYIQMSMVEYTENLTKKETYNYKEFLRRKYA